MLAGPGLALRGLDLHPRGLHPVADLADQRLVVGRGEDVVVEDVRHRRGEVAVVLRVRLRVGLLEDEELELGAELRREAERLRPLHLRLQHLARGGLHRRAVVPDDVGQDQRRRLEPGDAPQRGEVGREPEVAVAALPARHLVAGLGVHLHVEREQVVAALDVVAAVHLREEELGVQALAHQAALHVGEGDDHRVDLAARRRAPSIRRSRACERAYIRPVE